MENVFSRRYAGGWMVVLAVLVLLWGVLSLYRSTEAAGQAPAEPFANATAQRSEMIACLKEIRDLLKEQNALLKSGAVRVVLAEPASKPGKP
jgi:type VI protein secretion system component VasK